MVQWMLSAQNRMDRNFSDQMEIVKVKVELKVGVKENHFNNGVTDVTDVKIRTFLSMVKIYTLRLKQTKKVNCGIHTNICASAYKIIIN